MEADSGSGEIGSPSGAQSASVADAGLDASSLEEGEDDSTSQPGDEDDLIEQGEILEEQGEIADDDDDEDNGEHSEPVPQDFSKARSSHVEEEVHEDQPASPDTTQDNVPVTQENKDTQDVDSEDDGEIQDDDSQDGTAPTHGKGGKHAESDEGELVDEDGELTEDDSEEETKHGEEKRVNGHDWYPSEGADSKKASGDYSSKGTKPKANGLEESLSRAHITDDHQEHVELDYDEDVEEDQHSGKGGHGGGDGHRRSGEGVEEEEEEGAIVDRSDQEDGEIGEGESEDGELSEEEGEGEEGEIKDAAKKTFSRPVCKYYHRGNCTWGGSCKFVHVGVNDNDYGAGEEGELEEGAVDDTPTPGVREAPPSWPSMPPAPEHDPIEMDFMPPESPPKVESAWERGLRHAKEIMKRANKRKETEANFEEKKMNMGLDEAAERETEREPPERLAIQKDPYYDNIFDEDEDYYTRSAKEQWASGRYENFEVRWTREYPQASPPPQAYMYRSPSPKEELKYYKEKHHSSHHAEGHSNRHHHHHHHKHHRERRFSSSERKYRDRRKDPWREEALEEPMVDDMSARPSRGDEWKDPWMRSKPPTKPRASSRSRSRSRGRGKHRSRSGSYSSYSSRSRSRSRSSSRSSYSSRSSRSRSSSFSSRSRSRSRSRTPTPFRDKARLKKPPVSKKAGNKEPPPPGTEKDPPLKEKRPIPPPVKVKSELNEPPKSQVTVKQFGQQPGAPSGQGHPKQAPQHKGVEKRPMGPTWAPKPQPSFGAKPMASGRGGMPPGRGRRSERRPGKRRHDSLSSSSSSRSRSVSKSSSSSRSRSRSSSISSRSSISSSSSSGSADSEHLYRDIKAQPRAKAKKVPGAGGQPIKVIGAEGGKKKGGPTPSVPQSDNKAGTDKTAPAGAPRKTKTSSADKKSHVSSSDKKAPGSTSGGHKKPGSEKIPAAPSEKNAQPSSGAEKKSSGPASGSEKRPPHGGERKSSVQGDTGRRAATDSRRTGSTSTGHEKRPPSSSSAAVGANQERRSTSSGQGHEKKPTSAAPGQERRSSSSSGAPAADKKSSTSSSADRKQTGTLDKRQESSADKKKETMSKAEAVARKLTGDADLSKVRSTVTALPQVAPSVQMKSSSKESVKTNKEPAKASKEPSKASKEPTRPSKEPLKPTGKQQPIKLTLINKPTENNANVRKRSNPESSSAPPAKKPSMAPPKSPVKSPVKDMRPKFPARTDKGPDNRTERAHKPVSPKGRTADNHGPGGRSENHPPKISLTLASTKKVVDPLKGAIPKSDGGGGKKKSTTSRREELLKQLKAVEDAIARKRAKLT